MQISSPLYPVSYNNARLSFIDIPGVYFCIDIKLNCKNLTKMNLMWRILQECDLGRDENFGCIPPPIFQKFWYYNEEITVGIRQVLKNIGRFYSNFWVEKCVTPEEKTRA